MTVIPLLFIRVGKFPAGADSIISLLLCEWQENKIRQEKI
jgi:hypothetical protein